MTKTYDLPAKGGFSFDLCKRNEMLTSKGLKPPSFLKTGTTIVGLVYKDGVVLGADTRATEGPIVADKNCEKIHYMAPNIYCCGAGTAADTEAVTDMVSSHLKLHRYHTGRESRVVTALTLLKSHLFNYQGHVSAALVLGGVDVTGPHLHTIYPHGSTDTLPFATMGSGSLAAMAVFEAKYKEGMTLRSSRDEMPLNLLLEKCRSTTSLANARRLHALLLTTSDFPLSPFTSNHVLSMYAKCGSLSSARMVFDRMPHRNIVSYNSLISAYSRHPNLASSAFTLLAQMRRHSFWPNAASFNALLQGASVLRDLLVGLALHAQLLQSGFLLDAYAFTSLVGFYSNCGDLGSAVKLFGHVTVNDAVAWNCIISGCLKNDRVEEALRLFHRMLACSVIPTEFTYSMVLKACGKLGDYACGLLVHGRITVGNVLVDLPLQNALVDMYSSCGDVTSAFNVFNRIESPDLVSWNSMILACSEVGDGEKAMQLFTLMLGMDNVNPDEYSFAAVISSVAECPISSHGERLHALVIVYGCETSPFVGTALVSMYCATGRTDAATRVFEPIVRKDIVLWTELCSGFSKSGDSENALKLFRCMRQDGHRVDCFIVSTALNACADLAGLSQGQMIHCLCIKAGCDTEMSVCGSLIDMYSKSGSLQTAETIFYRVLEPDLKCWNSMVGCYGHHGKAKEGLQLLGEILSRGLKPDGVTFISLLSVCGHSGLVEMGRLVWRYMLQECGITPGRKHYSCMVSLLSRAGLFEEAMEMIKESSLGEICSVELWRAVLSSAVEKKKVEVGLYAANKVLEIEAEDNATHILVSNLYAGAGRWDGVMETRKRIRGMAMEKDSPGLSWIQLNKEFVVFSSGDHSHAHTDELQLELSRVHANLGVRPIAVQVM